MEDSEGQLARSGSMPVYLGESWLREVYLQSHIPRGNSTEQ